MVNVSKIRTLIKLKGMKVGHVCAELGMTHTYFSNVESGKATMPDDRIHKVADILGTTYEYLMDFTDNPSPPCNTTRLTHSLGTSGIAQRAAKNLKFNELYQKIAQKETAEADLAELERFMEYLLKRGE